MAGQGDGAVHPWLTTRSGLSPPAQPDRGQAAPERHAHQLPWHYRLSSGQVPETSNGCFKACRSATPASVPRHRPLPCNPRPERRGTLTNAEHLVSAIRDASHAISYESTRSRSARLTAQDLPGIGQGSLLSAPVAQKSSADAISACSPEARPQRHSNGYSRGNRNPMNP